VTDGKEGSGEYALRVLDNTTRYVKGLLDETKALRTRIAELEDEIARRDNKVRVLEQETRRQLEQFVEVEMQNSNVANLYVASFRLHGTLERDQVLAAIREIVINLIGSEELLVYELDDRAKELVLVTQFGMESVLERWRRLKMGHGIVGKTAETGELFVAADAPGGRAGAAPGEEHLQAAIPLVLDGRTTGVIAIFRLLGHKRGLEDVDRELFDLLARQAASALYCTKLNAKLVAAGLA